MKKTILCSFLTILVVGHIEDSFARYFSLLVGLNSTTMRARDRLIEEHKPASSRSSSADASSSSFSEAEIEDAIREEKTCCEREEEGRMTWKVRKEAH